MKCQTVLPACLLLLWALMASAQDLEIHVKAVSDGIELSCGDKDKEYELQKNGVKTTSVSGKLNYEDDNSGEYHCQNTDASRRARIYVKFRTCDNCIELDVASIIGLAAGNVVATVVIGVAVYLLASQTQSGPVASHKKSSDRQHLVSNEVSSRATNDHYQPLKHKGGQRDTYDVLTNRR